MSYLVLARKYRPKNFSEMVGQEHVVQALGNALTQQRLHHAYLFTGTRGVGKTTVSRILAKSLNCVGPDGQGGITAQPCGQCEVCRDIDAGRFVDYTELDAASNRGVDEVQALLEQAVYKPVVGRFKVFMIDEVHMLTGHAFNAMLKTLEEPPEYLKFVLATTDPQKVPVTVLSRCLQFNLRPMAPQTVQTHLQTVLQAESVGYDAAALRLLSRAARGSMRDALSLTDQAIAFGAGQLREPLVRQMLGAVDRSHAWRIIGALADGDGAAVVREVDGLRTHGLSAASTLDELCTVLQRMAIHQLAPDAAQVDDDPDDAESARLAQHMPADETQLLYSLCLQGRQELGLAPDEYAALSMSLLRLLAFKAPGGHGGAAAQAKKSPPAQAPAPERGAGPTAPAQPEPASVQGHAPTPAPAPALAAAPAPAPAASSDSASTSEPAAQPTEPAPRQPPAGPSAPQAGLDDLWDQTVRQLVQGESVTGLVRELALQSQLVHRGDDGWVLRAPRESLLQSQARLQAALAQAGVCQRLEVRFGDVTDSPALRAQAALAERHRQAADIINNDPFVQAMMRDFGAKIVPGTLQPV